MSVTRQFMSPFLLNIIKDGNIKILLNIEVYREDNKDVKPIVYIDQPNCQKSRQLMKTSI